MREPGACTCAMAELCHQYPTMETLHQVTHELLAVTADCRPESL
jgi:hypothetical protein